MTWELLHRGRWTLLAAALGGIAFPSIIYAALEREQILDPRHQSMLVLHFVLVQFSMIYLAVAIYGAQDKISRLYTVPASAATLVAWRMLPAMALIALGSLLVTSVLNELFPINWPLWGPALVLSVAFAAIQAIVWLTEKSLWIVAAIVFAYGAIVLWFKSRYGPLLGQPTHSWAEVTPGEVLTMLTAALAAYGVAVVGVARNRRGEPPLSLGIVAWLERKFDRAPATYPPLSSPIRAQSWFEWKHKGWAMPAGAAFGVLIFLAFWLAISRDAKELFQGLLAGGGMLSVLGTVGALTTGLTGANDRKPTISTFLATRPMTDGQLAAIIVNTAARSVVLAWSIWAATVLMFYLLLSSTGYLTNPQLPKSLGLWYFPTTIVSMWTVVGVGLSIGLSGRPEMFIRAIVSCLLIAIGVTLLSKFALSAAATQLLNNILMGTIGVGLVLLIASFFLAAHRRALISSPALAVALMVWVMLCAAAFSLGPPTDVASIPFFLLLVGALGLTVSPLAAAPLALAANRHR